MAKKKNKKKGKKHLNPHKLGEEQLFRDISDLMNRGKVDQAYNLVKVLLDRFDSSENRNLFKSVLERKIVEMENKGEDHSITLLINEAKKRFNLDVFSEADEYNRIRSLDDDRLISHFKDKTDIPPTFRYRIADGLFFSRHPDKEFIKKHKAFKDLFYVKEAFKNGYSTDNSKKWLAPVGMYSPFRYWLLLAKAIEAFFNDDSTLLEDMNIKIVEKTFPKFLIEKLYTCQMLLDGKEDGLAGLSQSDIEIFKLLCGESFFEVCFFNKASRLCEKGDIPELFRTVNIANRIIGKNEGNCLFALFLERTINQSTDLLQFVPYFKKQINIFKIESYALNRDHLFLKVFGLDILPAFELKLTLRQLADSGDVKNCRLFDPGILKAELLYQIAQKDDFNKYSEFSILSLLDRYPDDIMDQAGLRDTALLEESLQLSQHNPDIFVALVNKYREKKVKTSKINTVIKKLLKSFPDNPNGYSLAGDIAFKNKTYNKALGFYQQALKLMPLNREFPLTIIKCFEKMIEKRQSSDIHLVGKDLEKAKQYVQPTNRKAETAFQLLRAKALFKITEHCPETSDIHFPVIAGLHDLFRETPGDLFRYLAIFDGSPLGRNFINTYLSDASEYLAQNLDANNFSGLLSDYLKNDPDDLKGSALFQELLTGFFKAEMKKKTVTFDNIGTWLLQSLDAEWNALFACFVEFGRSILPQNPVLGLFMEIMRSRIDNQAVKERVLDEQVLEWFKTRQGMKLLDRLYEFDYSFGELSEILSDPGDAADWKEQVGYMLNEHYFSFNEFRHELLDMISEDDYQLLHNVRQCLGLADDHWKPKKQATSEKPLKSKKSQAVKQVENEVSRVKNEQLSFFDFNIQSE